MHDQSNDLINKNIQ